METYFYSFYKTVGGNLKLKGIYDIKYFEDEISNGLICFKGSEVDTAKGCFLVDRDTRTVKTLKTYLNNKSQQKLILKRTFVKL